jgi:VanZ family protein
MPAMIPNTMDTASSISHHVGKASPGRIALAWALLLVYVGFIYATLSSVPNFRDTLAQKYGDAAFSTLTYLGAALLILPVLGVMIFRNRERTNLAYGSLIAVLLLLRHAMRNWISIPVEQIHFVEYALVGFLCYNALRCHLRGWALMLEALLLGYFFGMVDECIQGHLSNRVGAQSDMFWNGLAVIMGLWVVAMCLKPRWIRGRSGLRELKVILLLTALILPIQGYFNSSIAQFGYLIHDAEIGVEFRSRLKAEEIPRYTNGLDFFKREVIPKAGVVRTNILLSQLHDKIHEEALVHGFRREAYREKRPYVAYKENLIIDKYFPQFIAGTRLVWNTVQIEKFRSSLGDSTAVTYRSPVAEHLITKFGERAMWTAIILLEIGLAASLWVTREKSRGLKVSNYMG